MREVILIANLLEIIVNEDDILIVGFSEDDTYENNVIIQYVEELTDYDIEMGWSKYYLEYSLLDVGAYSCIKSIIIEQSCILLDLNDHGISIFGLESIKIVNKFDNKQLIELVETFKSIFFEENIELNILL